MIAMKLTKNKITLIDKADFQLVKQWKWSYLAGGYAMRKSRYGPRKLGKYYCIYLHRFLLNAPKGIDVDHINGNKLDNRRSNLRLASRSQNFANQPKQKKLNCTSQFKGIYWDKTLKFWRVRIHFRHKKFEIGLFKNEIAAAMAYDIWVKDIQGEFAIFNFSSVIRN